MHEDDASWLRDRAPRASRSVAPRSSFVTMRDGVRLAVDVYAPRGAGRRPTIVRQTRYMRSLAPRRGAGLVARQFDLYARTRRIFLGAGYAWVDVDVRGTGASQGVWAYPWSTDEVADGAAIVDWIIAQPWSDGRVGALGISYDGTCADMLVTTRHPAVQAIAPMFALYDVFTDVAFPGGIHLAGFIERWATYNAALDRGDFHEGIAVALGLMSVAAMASPRPRPLERALALLGRGGESAARRRAARLVAGLVRGVRPVEGGAGALRFDRSANMDVYAIGRKVVFRDDAGLTDALPEVTIDRLSPHARRADAAASGAAIYSYSGWRDGGYPHSAVKRFQSVRTPGCRLTLGPWVHTGKLEVPAFDVARESRFDHDAEILGFFDEHVRGRPARGDGQPVHYFTMVEGRWKSAPAWPPPGSTLEPLYLAPRRTLSRARHDDPSTESFREDGRTGTGPRSRWQSLVSLAPGDYPDRRERDARLLTYDGPPLDRDTEVTGHPIVTLFVSTDAPDAHVFAYLEDVAPDGRVAYVTEGQLRLLHRRLADPPIAGDSPVPARSFLRGDARPMTPGAIEPVAFDLLPVSWLFRAGHRVRLALAGADADHFEAMAPRTLDVHASRDHASRIELPIVR